MGESPSIDLYYSPSNERRGGVGVIPTTAGDVVFQIIDSSLRPRETVNFVVEKNEGVYIDASNTIDSQVLLRYIDAIFQSGYYFLDFDYDRIMDLLYNQERLTMYCNNVKDNKIQPLIKIASGITDFKPKRREFYRKPIISHDKKTAEYYFENVYSEATKDDKIIEIQELLNVDEFIAAMWNYGLRFGLDIHTIGETIRKRETIRLIISTEKSSTESIDPIMEPAISFEINRGVKNDTLTQTDYLEYKQGYIRVDKDTVIYRKKPGELGKPGRTIGGDEILPRELREFSIESFRGKGLRIETIDGCECLVSEHSGFPRLEEGPIFQGRHQVKGLIKVHVDEEKVFQEIGMSTGKVSLLESIVSEKDIILDTRVGNLTAKKDVEANVYAIGDVMILGSVIGVAQSSMLNHQHLRSSSMFSKGHIETKHGNITINGYANDAYLEAREGLIHVKSVTNSLIVGKTVEITGMAFNCTIIADTINLTGRTIGCKIIGGNQVIIKESSEKGDFENIVNIFSRDLTEIIAKKQSIRNTLITKVQEIESKIDDNIIQRFVALRKIETGRRRSMTRIIVDLMQEPEKLKQEEYKGYATVYNLLKSELQKHSLSWKKVKELNLALDKITQEIKDEEMVMSGEQSSKSIQIGHIVGPTHIQHIKYLSDKKLLNFSVEEIACISHLIANRDPNTEVYKLEKIFASSPVRFTWKYNN